MRVTMITFGILSNFVQQHDMALAAAARAKLSRNGDDLPHPWKRPKCLEKSPMKVK